MSCTDPKSLRLLAAALGLALTTAACTPAIDVHGNMPDPKALAKIVPGQQDREQVEELLGTPSSTRLFEQSSAWFYIGKKTEQTAFFAPKVLEQRVVVISFNKEGKVSEVREMGQNVAQDVSPVSRTTPTPGQKMNFFQQMLGNVGRFNSQPKPGP